MKFENKDFVHLHCHSSYSRFDGISNIEDIVMQARKMGFKSIAITDHGNVMSWVKFLQLCKSTKDKKGKDIPYPPIKAILGSEFYLSRKMDIGQYDEKKDPEKIKQNQPDGRKGNRHLNLYAMNFQGYKNICRLSQASYRDGFYYDPRIDLDLLQKHSDGVMCGSACLSNVININLLYGQYDKAKKIAGIFNEIFKSNFFLEIMYHGIPEEKEIIPLILKLSTELNIPAVCSNDSHYVFKEQGESQEVFMTMSQQKCIKDPSRLVFNHKEFYLKSAEEMGKIFGHAPHLLHNTVMIADRIDTKDIEDNLFGGMRLPKFDIPSQYKNSYDYLCDLSWEGMKKLGWDKSEVHVKTLKMELEDILAAKESNDYDFSTYFLIVRDYIQYAKDNDILVGPGRGSGYSSLVLRCIGITYGVDPIKYGLLWDRFLGFKKSRFIKPSDFGFKNTKKSLSVSDLDKDREVENDLGGVDRY